MECRLRKHSVERKIRKEREEKEKTEKEKKRRITDAKSRRKRDSKKKRESGSKGEEKNPGEHQGRKFRTPGFSNKVCHPPTLQQLASHPLLPPPTHTHSLSVWDRVNLPPHGLGANSMRT